MAKKINLKQIFFYLYIGLGLGVILILVLFHLQNFKETTIRLTDIKDLENLKSFFEIYNEKSDTVYTESINKISCWIEELINNIDKLKEKSLSDYVSRALSSLLDFSFNFIIYFCNYGVNIILIAYICLHETFTGTNLKIRTTPLAKVFILIDKLETKAKITIVSYTKKFLSFLYDKRRIIFFSILGVLLGNGFLYRFFVEFIIFVIVYIIRMINTETYLVIFSIVKFLFIVIYPYLKYIPVYIWIPVIIILVFVNAISRAKYKLKKNHERLKDFVSEELTQTCFINGCPGTGKTLLNMSMSLACEENYIEELEEKLIDYEVKHKNINFANVRANPNNYPEHQDYTKIYKLLYERKSFIISNYAIYSPLFTDYSKIFNFDYMRVNKECDIYPLEEYIVISLSEFDKEYNSHDDKKIVGEDGAATFFSTVSHDLKRHAKLFVDYQLKDQVPLRIRGNAEYFITIKDRQKKYPFLLMIYYFPIIGLNKLTKHYLKKYELKKKRISKTSLRMGVGIYKRNDLTAIYIFLRKLAYTFDKISKWFDSFYYFKLKVIISEEDSEGKGKKRNLFINIRDLSYKNQRLYDSTFLSYSYKEKKNEDFMNLDTFTSITPEISELDKCNSRFYDKINHNIKDNS